MTTLQRWKGLSAPEAKREEKGRMASPNPVEQFKSIGTVIATITGAIGLLALIKKGCNAWRDKHPSFKRVVLKNLEHLKDGQKKFDDFNAAMLRERLESLYNVYVLEMGWCPRSAKQNIRALFDLYAEKYGNSSDHLSLKNRDKIMELPESKDRRKDFCQ